MRDMINYYEYAIACVRGITYHLHETKLTIYVRYDILGKLELTTDLNATAVRTRVNES